MTSLPAVERNEPCGSSVMSPSSSLSESERPVGARIRFSRRMRTRTGCAAAAAAAFAAAAEGDCGTRLMGDRVEVYGAMLMGVNGGDSASRLSFSSRMLIGDALCMRVETFDGGAAL